MVIHTLYHPEHSPSDKPNFPVRQHLSVPASHENIQGPSPSEL